MPCETIPFADGMVIVCSRRSRRPKCSVPHCAAVGTQLCDWPLEFSQGTCDRPMCVRHAVHVGPNRDYCPKHGHAGP